MLFTRRFFYKIHNIVHVFLLFSKKGRALFSSAPKDKAYTKKTPSPFHQIQLVLVRLVKLHDQLFVGL